MLQFNEVIAWTCNGLQKICQTVSDIAKKQLKNSDIKTSERQKKIKESDNSLLRNYWNKTKYIWLNNRKI